MTDLSRIENSFTSFGKDVNVNNHLTNASTDRSKGLGRVVAIDFRDAKFPLKLDRDASSTGLNFKYYQTSTALDQGDTPQCVAYTGEQLLLSAPVKNLLYKTPLDLYNECQKNDEWSDQIHDGSSTRGLFKALQLAGYITEYRWANSLADIIQYLLTQGPVCCGTNWYNSQFYPDKNGFVTVKGASGIAGGHEYLAKGVNTGKLCPDGSRGAIRFMNSWGTEWADKGMFWMSFADVKRLFSEQGEAGVVSELKVPVEKKG